MRSLARHPFAGSSVASLLPCATATAGWVRSSNIADTWNRRNPTGAVTSEFSVHSQHGSVGFKAENQAAVSIGSKPWSRTSSPAALTAAPHWLKAQRQVRYAHFEVFTGVLPRWWVIRRHPSTLRRCQKPGLCADCGYDLRASSGRCPECGRVSNG